MDTAGYSKVWCCVSVKLSTKSILSSPVIIMMRMSNSGRSGLSGLMRTNPLCQTRVTWLGRCSGLQSGVSNNWAPGYMYMSQSEASILAMWSLSANQESATTEHPGYMRPDLYCVSQLHCTLLLYSVQPGIWGRTQLHLCCVSQLRWWVWNSRSWRVQWCSAGQGAGTTG